MQAAEAVIAADGYEAATMCAIAERAGAPIGSLYQFFPSKQAITHALRTGYGQDYEQRLNTLRSESEGMTLPALVARLVDLTVGFIESHPAFLALLDAPSSTRSPASLRLALREKLAACFTSLYPGLSKRKALRLAAVTLQLLRGLNQLYAESSPAEQRQYVREYKLALSYWLAARLEVTRRSEPT
jgi:AcrR family transcriptional regulator